METFNFKVNFSISKYNEIKQTNKNPKYLISLSLRANPRLYIAWSCHCDMDRKVIYKYPFLFCALKAVLLQTSFTHTFINVLISVCKRV